MINSCIVLCISCEMGPGNTLLHWVASPGFVSFPWSQRKNPIMAVKCSITRGLHMLKDLGTFAPSFPLPGWGPRSEKSHEQLFTADRLFLLLWLALSARPMLLFKPYLVTLRSSSSCSSCSNQGHGCLPSSACLSDEPEGAPRASGSQARGADCHLFGFHLFLLGGLLGTAVAWTSKGKMQRNANLHRAHLSDRAVGVTG